MLLPLSHYSLADEWKTSYISNIADRAVKRSLWWSHKVGLCKLELHWLKCVNLQLNVHTSECCSSVYMCGPLISQPFSLPVLSTCIWFTHCWQLCTCFKASLHPHTLGATHCRHNVVVSGGFTEPLREGDGCHLTLGGGGVLVDQVGVRWVCTIVNGADVSWLI